jgi:hypothetical protein
LVVGFERLDPEEILGVGSVWECLHFNKIILIRGAWNSSRVDCAFKESAKNGAVKENLVKLDIKGLIECNWKLIRQFKVEHDSSGVADWHNVVVVNEENIIDGQ